MDNENIMNNQPAPVVEKVSLDSINSEKESLDNQPVTDNSMTKLLNIMMSMNEKELKKAAAYVEKKIEKLNKLK